MQSSHVNLHRISTANAFLRESQQAKSSGLNLWVGRLLSHLLLLLLHWMFVAFLMKFGHGTCFLSAPNLSWYWHNKRHMLLLSPPLSVLLFVELFCQRCLSLLKANSFGISNTHLASPMSCEPLAARYELVSAAFPSANLQPGWLGCADHACVPCFTLLSSRAATRQQPAPAGTNSGFSFRAKPRAHLGSASSRLPLCHT